MLRGGVHEQDLLEVVRHHHRVGDTGDDGLRPFLFRDEGVDVRLLVQPEPFRHLVELHAQFADLVGTHDVDLLVQMATSLGKTLEKAA